MKNFEFINGGYDVRINKQDQPYPWVNYLTNTRLTAMISQAGGGFLWHKNPVRLRITRYRYNQLPTDTPGFYIYIKEPDGRIWCPTFQPMQDKETVRYSIHRPGETCFVAENRTTKAELTLYVPPETDVLVWELTLTNNGAEAKDYQVYAYAELSQFDWISEQNFGYYWQHMLRTSYDRENEILFYNFNFVQSERNKPLMPLVYFASDLPVKSFCGDRDAFVGDYRSEANPIALESDTCGNEEIASGNACAALQVVQPIEAGESKTCHFFLGVREGSLIDYVQAREASVEDVRNLRDPAFVAKGKKQLEDAYRAHFDRFVCTLPDKELERHINIWGPLNAMQFSLFHPTPQPSAPGIRSIGARDKLQALMPMVLRSPQGVREGLLFMLSVQYVNGAISHNIRGYMNIVAEPGAYRREAIKSDDHLWIPFLAYAVAAETDVDLLDEEVGYFELNGTPSQLKETVWQHLMRVVEFTQSNLGEHGLPLMLDGDWNDIISKFSKGGKGESVFAAEQYVAALNKMIELARYTGREEDAAYLENCRAGQIRALLTHAWNGKWWYRCFDDNGTPIGGESDTFGRLWLNPQSWAIIAGVGSEEQRKGAYTAVENTLDTGYGLKLLDPGFKTYPDVMDPFSPYNPGTGENGAIFCHAHTWSILAESILGNAEKAWKYYEDLLPFRLHERLGTDVYKSDPFGWVSNIVGPENSKHGWGNVIRLTGTCSWMNIAATQYLLGVRVKLDGVKLDPCIPADWKEFRVERDYLGCRLNITFRNPNGVSKGVTSVTVDGVRYETNTVSKDLLKGKTQAEIVAIMG